eukprot:9158977-Lingulodinium_polyedra.AAC.1
MGPALRARWRSLGPGGGHLAAGAPGWGVAVLLAGRLHSQRAPRRQAFDRLGAYRGRHLPAAA